MAVKVVVEEEEEQEVVVITLACPFHSQCPAACFHSDTQSGAQEALPSSPRFLS